jgi:hypothetical protein
LLRYRKGLAQNNDKLTSYRTINSQSPSPTPLIYLASIGRSGSTLLELLLHTHDDIWTLGELYVLPWYIRENRGRCGCGEILDECAFWRPVIDKMGDLLSVTGNIALYREHYASGRFFRPGLLLRIVSGRRIAQNDKAAGFCSDNAGLLSAIRSRAEEHGGRPVKYLVDASKDFYRLNHLCGCPGVDLKVIHIVKDPRAYMFSRIKVKDTFSVATMIEVLRLSLKYTLENILIGRILKKLPAKNTFFLKYEDLASRPEAVLKSLCRWLGLTMHQHPPDAFRDIINHGIAGNSMRHRSEGIYLDQQWKMILPGPVSKLTGLITFFPAKSYGYPLF